MYCHNVYNVTVYIVCLYCILFVFPQIVSCCGFVTRDRPPLSDHLGARAEDVTALVLTILVALLFLCVTPTSSSSSSSSFSSFSSSGPTHFLVIIHSKQRPQGPDTQNMQRLFLIGSISAKNNTCTINPLTCFTMASALIVYWRV